MNFKNKKEKDDFIVKNMKLVDYVINRRLGLFNTYDYTYDDVKQMVHLFASREIWKGHSKV